MSHKVVPLREAVALSKVCELKGVAEGDISPCSHFDYCERQAVIWIRSDGFTSGLCQQCYDYCYPTTNQWYRVVKVAPEFSGKL